MQGTRLVRCDEVAIRIFGLSLAGWNAFVSLVIASIAALGARSASLSAIRVSNSLS
jgi:disulfide bond formation protein DsbB